MSFWGKFNQTIDSKNRIFIPTSFRNELEENFFIFNAPDGCLFLVSQNKMDQIMGNLISEGAVMEDRQMQRNVTGSITLVNMDKQGRVTLNSEHVDWARLTKEIIFVGVGERVELWEPKAYEENLFPTDILSKKLDEKRILF